MLTLAFAVLGGASPAFAASTNGNTVEIDVMTHLCKPSVKNLADFQALANGLDPIAGFAQQVLACPTVVLPQNMPVAGTVADPQSAYQYMVTDEHGVGRSLSSAMFSPEKLCESDINKDVNGDGTISSTTCLDTSEYHFNQLSLDNGRADVQESMPPQGYHYGTFLFTPVQIDANNDRQSFLTTDDSKGVIKLDTSNDADKVITLHVYDFANSDNPKGYVNGMPIPTATGTTSTSTNTITGTVASSTASSIISQIIALEMQIQNLEAQIHALLAMLLK